METETVVDNTTSLLNAATVALVGAVAVTALPETAVVPETVKAVMAPKRKYTHSVDFVAKQHMKKAQALVANAKLTTDAPRFLNAQKLGVKALDVGTLEIADLTDRERRIFDAVIGDANMLKARSLTEIAVKSFPDHTKSVARIMACIVLRKLANGGLIARVKRGWYLPQKRALAAVLNEKAVKTA